MLKKRTPWNSCFCKKSTFHYMIGTCILSTLLYIIICLKVADRHIQAMSNI